MKTLIVSSTYNEIEIFLARVELKKITETFYSSENIDVLISGIGSAFTIFSLTQHLSKFKYKLIINIGIAGSFNKSFSIGEVVCVTTDCFADLGVDNNGRFKTLHESGLIPKEIDLTHSPNIYFNNLKKVKAITVNTASGSKLGITKLINKYNADIESMEGASVAFVANNKNIEVIQIRAISNYVEPRNKANWEIKLAIKNLNKTLLSFIEQQ